MPRDCKVNQMLEVDVPYLSAQDSVSFANHIKAKEEKDGLREEFAMFAYEKNVSISVINLLFHRLLDVKLKFYTQYSFCAGSSNSLRELQTRSQYYTTII